MFDDNQFTGTTMFMECLPAWYLFYFIWHFSAVGPISFAPGQTLYEVSFAKNNFSGEAGSFCLW
jgi:hypothetical protein